MKWSRRNINARYYLSNVEVNYYNIKIDDFFWLKDVLIVMELTPLDLRKIIRQPLECGYFKQNFKIIAIILNQQNISVDPWNIQKLILAGDLDQAIVVN